MSTEAWVERGEGVPEALRSAHQVSMGVARRLLHGATGALEAWSVLLVWRPSGRPEASLLPFGSLVHWLRRSGELGREVALRVEQVRGERGELVPVVMVVSGAVTVVTYVRDARRPRGRK